MCLFYQVSTLVIIERNMSNNKFNFGHEDNATQNWGVFNGYDLRHLNSSLVKYIFDDQEYKVYVTYSHHCFAKTIPGYNDQAQMLFPHPKDPRHFHHERYMLSLELPNIIKELPTLYTFHGGGKDNYCSCKVVNQEGKSIDYLVVFTVFRSIRKLRLHVTSAYPETPGKTNKVRFEKIIKALRSGRKLPGPK